MIYAPYFAEKCPPELARKMILGIGKKMDGWVGVGLPLEKIELTFAVLEGFLETGAHLDAYERMGLIDGVSLTAGNCIRAYPNDCEGVENAALPLLGKLCRFEDKGKMLWQFTPYLKANLEHGYELKKRFILRMLAGMGESGAEIFWSSDSVRDSAILEAGSWNGRTRKAARELIYAMSRGGNTFRSVMAPDADAFSAGRGFAAKETNPKVVAKIFEIAYVAGVRGSRWGMELASAIILNRETGEVHEGQIRRKLGEAMAGCSTTGSGKFEALHRARYLNRLLRERGWMLAGDKKKFPARQARGREGGRNAVADARRTLNDMNMGLRIVQGRATMDAIIKDRVKA
jgi:hypothetical protein